MQKKISKFFIRLENSSLFEKRALIKIHFYKYLIVSSLGKTSIDFSVDDFNSLKKAILLPKSYMKKPNLLGYSIHIERYRITSAFGFNNYFEILTNSKTLNFLSKIKTLFVNNKKTKALLLLSSSKGGYNAYSIDGVKGFLPRNQISYSSTNQINLFKDSISKIQFIWIFFKISKVTILFKNNKENLCSFIFLISEKI
jgi:hypothetical protein